MVTSEVTSYTLLLSQSWLIRSEVIGVYYDDSYWIIDPALQPWKEVPKMGRPARQPGKQTVEVMLNGKSGKPSPVALDLLLAAA